MHKHGNPALMSAFILVLVAGQGCRGSTSGMVGPVAILLINIIHIHKVDPGSNPADQHHSQSKGCPSSMLNRRITLPLQASMLPDLCLAMSLLAAGSCCGVALAVLRGALVTPTRPWLYPLIR